MKSSRGEVITCGIVFEVPAYYMGWLGKSCIHAEDIPSQGRNKVVVVNMAVAETAVAPLG